MKKLIAMSILRQCGSQTNDKNKEDLMQLSDHILLAIYNTLKGVKS